MNDPSNEMILAGRIVTAPVYDHTIFGEAFYKMEVGAKRLSGAEDILPVTVSERLLGDTPPNEGDAVEITGQIRSYNLKDEAGSHLIITVFAREIRFLAELAFDRNETELIGHLCKPVIYRKTPFEREIADVLIAVNRRYGKSDYLPAIAWGRNARFANTLSSGDAVRLRGRMSSYVPSGR